MLLESRACFAWVPHISNSNLEHQRAVARNRRWSSFAISQLIGDINQPMVAFLHVLQGCAETLGEQTCGCARCCGYFIPAYACLEHSWLWPIEIAQERLIEHITILVRLWWNQSTAIGIEHRVGEKRCLGATTLLQYIYVDVVGIGNTGICVSFV